MVTGTGSREIADISAIAVTPRIGDLTLKARHTLIQIIA
jgi:hypothetical protein